MSLYEITHDDGAGTARSAYRQQLPAAKRLARLWAYERLRASALLDRPIAVNTLNAIEAWDGASFMTVVDKGSFGRITLERLYGVFNSGR
ncbi:MAG TPA: hypothetical protein VMT20_15375 [Terriglobia bacterium]|nr:hypothetical protein [Terriglobia bacterium]